MICRENNRVRDGRLAHDVRSCAISNCREAEAVKLREAAIPFPTQELAEIARRVISVDKELKPALVDRQLTVNGSDLIAYAANAARFGQSLTYRFCRTFRAVSVRQARVALDHFFSDVELVSDTMLQLGPDVKFA